MVQNTEANHFCLTADQLSELLIDDNTTMLALDLSRRHLSQCPACRAEYNQPKGRFGNLRESSHQSAALAQAQIEIRPQTQIQDRAGHKLLARPALRSGRSPGPLP